MSALRDIHNVTNERMYPRLNQPEHGGLKLKYGIQLIVKIRLHAARAKFFLLLIVVRGWKSSTGIDTTLEDFEGQTG